MVGLNGEEVLNHYFTKRELSVPQQLSDRILPDTDFVTVASGSAARALAEMTEAECRQKARIISIGPETTRAALEAGLTVAATAEEATAEGMAQAVRALVDQEKTGRC